MLTTVFASASVRVCRPVHVSTAIKTSRIISAQSSPRLFHTFAKTKPVFNSAPATKGRRKADVDQEELHKDTIETIKQQYVLPHPIWRGEFVDSVTVTHREPESLVDSAAHNIIRMIRFNFDWMSGYSWRVLTEQIWITRIMFLETIAGIPGAIGGVLRHLKSLRHMKRDHGWIHTLYEEAENERMHLLTMLALRKPSLLMRIGVFLSQGVFYNFFFLSYILYPKFCHRLVGYLEEEAVKTYTHCLSEIDKGHLPWKTTPAPEIAIEYWKLDKDATMRDVIAVIRADEAHHRDVNHTFASLKPDDSNPFPPGH